MVSSGPSFLNEPLVLASPAWTAQDVWGSGQCPGSPARAEHSPKKKKRYNIY